MAMATTEAAPVEHLVGEATTADFADTPSLTVPRQRRLQRVSVTGGTVANKSAATTKSEDIRNLFCNNSSLRGVPRICRADTVFLRCLWLVFVLSMFALLLYSSARILINYREYDVSVQTSVVANDASEFPAITVCNHYPFSRRAQSLWSSGRATSPAQFNKRLRQLTRQLLFNTRLNMANSLLFYDKVNTYYQNLEGNLTVEMSHTVDEFLLHCMIAIGNYVSVGGSQDCQLTFQLVSHPKYFNCYTIKPKLASMSKSMSAMYLIFDLGPNRDQQKWEEAFVMDVFDQAYGLRLLLHEANLHPDIEGGGVHIEPGKMVEIAFETVQWKETQDSPIDICHNSLEPVIQDLQNSYAYSYEGCKDEQMNQMFIKKCHCLLSRLPRPIGLPSREIPYCGDFRLNTSKLEMRLKCLARIGEQMNRQKELHAPVCRKRCSSYTYQQELSITQWRVNNFQLHWMLHQSRLWKRLRAETREGEKRKILTKIVRYLDAANLSTLPQDSPASGRRDILGGSEANYAYVVVRRKSFDILKREEKLTVTFEALISRVGGLCSLYLGLTMAFFVEIVEFIYLAYHRRLRSK